MTPQPSEQPPRYIIVTPAEGAVITMAVPWDQIEQALTASGFRVTREAAAPDPKDPPDEHEHDPDKCDECNEMVMEALRD